MLPDLPSLDDPLPSLATAGAPQSLSARAKAAIVVRLLVDGGADIPLEELPDELQTTLTHQMGAMRRVDRATLASVVDEFIEELDRIGLTFSGGMAGALDTLEGKISRETAARLRKEAGVKSKGDPWARLRDLGAEALLPVLENESTEIAAVLLSKLSVPLAAELLGQLPGPQARRIAYAVSLTSGIRPEAVERIGLSLATQLDSKPDAAFDEGPVERVGAILNSATSLTRDDVLTGLDETDAGFASAVRKAIFTFGNIAERIAPRDIPRILRVIDQAVLVTALGGAENAGFEKSRDFILDNMSKRMADQIREEMSDIGTPKRADAETAMSDIVAVIRKMEQDGELLLVVDEEENAE